MKAIVILAEAQLKAQMAHFQLTKAIAEQMALTGEAEALLNNSIASFDQLSAGIAVLKDDVDNIPPVQ
jgi:ATP phosphoribosyltransferase regulatory subunit HisZ